MMEVGFGKKEKSWILKEKEATNQRAEPEKKAGKMKIVGGEVKHITNKKKTGAQVNFLTHQRADGSRRKKMG